MNFPLRALGSVAAVYDTMRDWKMRLEKLSSPPPFFEPVFLPFVAPGNGVYHLDHKLGRKPRGWMVTDPDGAARVWRARPHDAEQIHLSTDAAVSCVLWVW